jgi:hypothetical protein
MSLSPLHGVLCDRFIEMFNEDIEKHGLDFYRPGLANVQRVYLDLNPRCDMVAVHISFYTRDGDLTLMVPEAIYDPAETSEVDIVNAVMRFFFERDRPTIIETLKKGQLISDEYTED